MRCTLSIVAAFVALAGAPFCNGLAYAQPPAAAAMSPSTPETATKNIALIRAHYELLNKGDWRTALTYFADDTKNFGRPVGRVGLGFVLQDVWQTFPDFRLDIIDIIAQGDVVIVRGKSSGTHLGTGRLPVNGGMLVDVPPTHKHFQSDVIHWWVVRDGKIVDHYGMRDDIDMMRQLGLLPAEKPFDPSRLSLQ